MTYGYRRICALLNRKLEGMGKPLINHKRVYRIMRQNGLLLTRHTGKQPKLPHEGKVITLRSNSRWCSDGFEIPCCQVWALDTTYIPYARALGADMSNDLEWTGGDHMALYNIAPGRCPWMIMLHNPGLEFISYTWGYRAPEEAAAKKKPWINARVEKALTGRYFRHMFREGRVIIPGGGWFEWTLENGKKQPWYIKRKDDKPISWQG